MFQFESGSWVQLGLDIDGATESEAGAYLSLSSDGTSVAIGNLNFFAYLQTYLKTFRSKRI